MGGAGFRYFLAAWAEIILPISHLLHLMANTVEVYPMFAEPELEGL